MMRRLTCLIILVALAGCTPRGTLQPAGALPVPGKSIRSVFVATDRQPAPRHNDPLAGQRFGAVRDARLHYARLDVSIPPGHREGRIEWPDKTEADPERHFTVADSELYSGPAPWRAAIDDRQPPGGEDVVLFVPGFNTTHARAVYRTAQIAEDFDARQPVVVFSWPSAGMPGRYVYDRDSVIFARDGLEQLLRDLTRGGDRTVTIVAHSMGSQLVMETLRQISIAGGRQTLSQVSAVALLSPDIDEDVFLAQARRIDPFPQPFVLMVSARDRVLELAAWLVGRPSRLGSIEDPGRLAGLPVTVVDLTGLGEGGLPGGHSTAFTAPAAIALIRDMAPAD